MSPEIYARWAPKLGDAVKHVGAAIFVVALLIVGFWGGHFLTSGDTHESSADGPPEEPPPLASLVTLTPEKMASADIAASPVEEREVNAAKTVAATIEYDASRFVSLRAPVGAVIDTLSVKPGQVVSEGDLLATLSSSEIALARSEIREAQSQTRLAQIEYDWRRSTHDNLTALLNTLQRRPSVAEIEDQFDQASLGAYRDQLLTTYSQFQLATSVADRIKPLDEKGLVPGRMAEQRTSERDVAATSFKTACEQSRFESKRELARAEAQLDVAQRQLEVNEERLRLLLGPFADGVPGDSASQFQVRAPLAGRIESLAVAPSARVAQGEPLLVLADTSRLWVSALLHQHDWDALRLDPQPTVRVSVPAMPGEQFEARVSFVGAEVSAATRALPLVAEFDNAAGRLRPGMFAWVALPMESPRRSLTVSPASIQRHESQPFVFLQESADTFRRVDVKTGLETAEYVEILDGLKVGDKVVDRGAFFLKSELLLEQEEE
ncbi:MAG: efflux RND transporter periplasmic adaptor subunit [Pirellulaceae bacterium]